MLGLPCFHVCCPLCLSPSLFYPSHASVFCLFILVSPVCHALPCLFIPILVSSHVLVWVLVCVLLVSCALCSVLLSLSHYVEICSCGVSMCFHFPHHPSVSILSLFSSILCQSPSSPTPVFPCSYFSRLSWLIPHSFWFSYFVLFWQSGWINGSPFVKVHCCLRCLHLGPHSPLHTVCCLQIVTLLCLFLFFSPIPLICYFCGLGEWRWWNSGKIFICLKWIRKLDWFLSAH